MRAEVRRRFAAALLAVACGCGAAAPAAGDVGRVGYAHLGGAIDRLRHRYLDRVVDDARERGLDTLIVHIDTDGGEVSHAREMFKRVIDQARGGPRMIAYVDFRAISAGAMIAYAHEAIYVAETASIGDIGVIFVDREGEIRYAPEKIETVVRTLLAQAAEQRGWDRALLLKMTARNQKLYRAILPGGQSRYVIEDDLPDFLLAHPGFDPDDERRLLLYRGEDRLLTLTGREALAMGMATGEAADLDALYETLGIPPETVVDLSPSVAETLAWRLAPIAPLLAGLAFLFLLLELQTPGTGLWTVLAGALGALFLAAQFYLDMAENFEVLLLLAGLALIAVEFFTMAGAGVLGVTGAGLALVALILLFLPNEVAFDPAAPAFREALAAAALRGFIAVGVAAAGCVAFLVVLPRSPLRRRLSVMGAITGTSGGSAAVRTQPLIGRRGHAPDGLRPSGPVVVDGEVHSARAELGVYVAPGGAVEVVAVEFGELVVRAAPGGRPGAPGSSPP